MATYFSLTAHVTDSEIFAQIVEAMESRGILEAACIEPDGIVGHFSCIDFAKWNEYETDMREISELFPTVHFELHGEGETAGDIWNAHFLNGKMQVCMAEIVIQPFDPTKLS